MINDEGVLSEESILYHIIRLTKPARIKQEKKRKVEVQNMSTPTTSMRGFSGAKSEVDRLVHVAVSR